MSPGDQRDISKAVAIILLVGVAEGSRIHSNIRQSPRNALSASLLANHSVAEGFNLPAGVGQRARITSRPAMSIRPAGDGLSKREVLSGHLAVALANAMPKTTLADSQDASPQIPEGFWSNVTFFQQIKNGNVAQVTFNDDNATLTAIDGYGENHPVVYEPTPAEDIGEMLQFYQIPFNLQSQLDRQAREEAKQLLINAFANSAPYLIFGGILANTTFGGDGVFAKPTPKPKKRNDNLLPLPGEVDAFYNNGGKVDRFRRTTFDEPGKPFERWNGTGGGFLGEVR